MADVACLTREQLTEQLATLERESGMSPTAFYERFRAGDLGDSDQVMHWAGICYMAQRSGMLTSPPGTPIAR